MLGDAFLAKNNIQVFDVLESNPVYVAYSIQLVDGWDSLYMGYKELAQFSNPSSHVLRFKWTQLQFKPSE